HAPLPTPRLPPSLHDALPISDTDRAAPSGSPDQLPSRRQLRVTAVELPVQLAAAELREHGADARGLPESELGEIGAVDLEPHVADRKSTRLNSSHVKISYAVF